MTNGIVQLVAIGAQDVHLTGDPQVSFYKSAFKRHTNFSIFQKKQIFQGSPRPGGMSTVRVERVGDLLNYMSLSVTLNGVSQLISDWSDVIEYAELLIGGQVIDKQDVEFTEEIAIDLMSTTSAKSYPASLHGGVGSSSLFYPFRFFFCENWQSSLPLVALQYHDVEIRIKWSSSFNSSYMCTMNNAYISLDTEEREWFATTPHEILMFQVQKSVPSNEKIQELYFNHPVKFLASSNTTTNSLVSLVSDIKIEANGVEITEFNKSAPFYTAIPCYYHTDYSSSNAETLFVYPFCLNTAKLQPTGSLNFSRLDSFKIHCTHNITRPIYAVNYNILRIQNGMAGIVYAN